MTRRTPTVLKIAGVALWAVALLFVLAVGAELWLGAARDRQAHPSPDADDDSRIGRLSRAYRPFHIQHLHPQYLFFFPFEPTARVALSNDVVHLTPEGFRGEGPAGAGGRKLAFFLGGSAAFGEYATSDRATIAGYLNELQQEYFFVNAGVPSWISTQEMFRLAYELLPYKPSLVLAYHGANDADVLINHQEEGGGLSTVGAAESFLHLQRLVDDIRGEARHQPWFPELRRWFSGARDPGLANARGGRISDDVMTAAVARYGENLSRMHDMTAAIGARFVAAFQPISGLHTRVRRDFASWSWENDAPARFHRGVLSSRRPTVEFHDLAAVFDAHFPDVPVLGRNTDLTDETVFVDAIHITDRGNRIVAMTLLELLRRAPR